MGERQHDMFDRWLGLVTGGVALQTDLLTALNKTTMQTGLFLQRQNVALAESWMRAATGTKGARTPVTPGPTRQFSTGGQRQEDSDTPTTDRDASQTQATETITESRVQQASPEEQPFETARESAGGPVTATTSGRETEGSDSESDLDQIETLGPMAAEQLRSVDVQTIEQLARARTKDLAAETGLHPRRVRVWIFHARRVGDW